MKKHGWRKAVVGVAAVATVGLLAIQLFGGQDGERGDHKQHGAMQHKAAVKLDCKEQAAHLQAALKAVDAATKAVNSGNKKAALAELAKARRLVAATHKALLAGAAKHKFANTLCPIMGMKLDLAKVPGNLTRQHKGQTVALCCGHCPETWDKLTDAQKDAKLAKAKPKADHSGHKQKPASHHKGH